MEPNSQEVRALKVKHYESRVEYRFAPIHNVAAIRDSPGRGLMKNVHMAVEGNILTIKVDLSIWTVLFGQNHHHCFD